METRKLMRHKLFLVLAIALAFSASAIAAKGGSHGKPGGGSGGGTGGGNTTSVFTLVGKLNVSRSYQTATRLNDGQVLIAGGNHYDAATGNTTIYSSAEIYDPATQSFTLVASMNKPRVYHTATLLSDGRVLVTGGNSGIDPSTYTAHTENTAEIYDPSTNVWTLLPATMIEARYDHNATLLQDGNVLITSNAIPWLLNFDNAFGNNTAELYDAASQSFIALPYMKAIRVFHFAGLRADGNVALIGGQQDNVWNDTSELYDAASQTFLTAANMNYVHEGLSGLTLNASGDALITGQVDPWDMGHSAEIYHADTGSFSMAGDMVQTRQYHTSAISADHSKVLIVGGRYDYIVNGYTQYTKGTPDAEVYDVASNTFTDIGPLNFDRYAGETLTALDDGSFLVVGGSAASDNAEIYHP